MKQNREEWCLILGTVLVPSFQFQQRGELARLLDAMIETVTTHAEEQYPAYGSGNNNEY